MNRGLLRRWTTRKLVFFETWHFCASRTICWNFFLSSSIVFGISYVFYWSYLCLHLGMYIFEIDSISKYKTVYLQAIAFFLVTVSSLYNNTFCILLFYFKIKFFLAVLFSFLNSYSICFMPICVRITLLIRAKILSSQYVYSCSMILLYQDIMQLDSLHSLDNWLQVPGIYFISIW